MKVMGGRDYSLTNMNMYTRNYADISLAHSHQVTDGLTIGVRLKYLAGLAYAETLMDNMELSVYGNQWKVNAKGSVAASFMGARMLYGEDGAVTGITEMQPELSGMGVGADLGVVYDFGNLGAKGLTLSAAVCDINYIKWKNVSRAGVSPDKPYIFKGFDNIPLTDAESAIEDQLGSIAEDLGDFFVVKDMGVGSYDDVFGATLNLGLEYKMPFYERLSFGMLYTQRLDQACSWSEGRFAASVAPVNWFSATTNYAISNFGHSWGGALNLHTRGFGFFVGLDSFTPLFNVSPQFIPIDSINTNLSLGINFTFGEYKGRFPKKTSKKTTVKTVTVQTTETVQQ